MSKIHNRYSNPNSNFKLVQQISSIKMKSNYYKSYPKIFKLITKIQPQSSKPKIG